MWALTRLSRVALLRPGGGWIADIRLNAPERAGLRVAALAPVSGSPRMARQVYAIAVAKTPLSSSLRGATLLVFLVCEFR